MKLHNLQKKKNNRKVVWIGFFYFFNIIIFGEIYFKVKAELFFSISKEYELGMELGRISYYYFSTVISTTLGFGEILPKPILTQSLVVVQVMLSTFLIGLFLNEISKYREKQEEFSNELEKIPYYICLHNDLYQYLIKYFNLIEEIEKSLCVPKAESIEKSVSRERLEFLIKNLDIDSKAPIYPVIEWSNYLLFKVNQLIEESEKIYNKYFDIIDSDVFQALWYFSSSHSFLYLIRELLQIREKFPFKTNKHKSEILKKIKIVEENSENIIKLCDYHKEMLGVLFNIKEKTGIKFNENYDLKKLF